MIGTTTFLNFFSDIVKVMQPIIRKTAKVTVPVLLPENNGQQAAKSLAWLINTALNVFNEDAELFKEHLMVQSDYYNYIPYTGRFMLRTKAKDDMNVWFGFNYPGPSNIAKTQASKQYQKPKAVTVRTLPDREADILEQNLSGVDLVIKFKDILTLQELFMIEKFDIVDFLFAGKIEIYGNQNQLFKLGALMNNLPT